MGWLDGQGAGRNVIGKLVRMSVGETALFELENVVNMSVSHANAH
jgi:hypothetical protein